MNRSSPRAGLASLLALSLFLPAPGCGERPVTIGSKMFTESVILGEMSSLLIEHAGLEAYHEREIGGSRFLWSALLHGEIDLYPEYTGTISQEILRDPGVRGHAAIRAALAELGVGVSPPLGFNNTYAFGMKKQRAADLRIETISDLARHPELSLGFSEEFMHRGDGWPSLRSRYRLPHEDVMGIHHDIAYRGLDDGSLDVIDLYTTDAEIRYHDLKVLEDDLGHFPQYDALFVYRADLETRAPKVVQELFRLGRLVSEERMITMNGRAKIGKVHEAQVAADFLADALGVDVDPEIPGRLQRIWTRTLEHLFLVTVSLVAAIAAGIPLGIWAAKTRWVSPVILGTVGVVQTLPALALLVLLMPVLHWVNLRSLGATPAILALFLYSLLPIVRNTFTGLQSIPASLRESAIVLGLPAGARLRLVEMPMASRTILAGIKTAAVINVGFATLGALIAAGGYGQPILTGIRLYDFGLILEGALPASGMALVVQALFELAERVVVPRGLRLKEAR